LGRAGIDHPFASGTHSNAGALNPIIEADGGENAAATAEATTGANVIVGAKGGPLQASGECHGSGGQILNTVATPVASGS